MSVSFRHIRIAAMVLALASPAALAGSRNEPTLESAGGAVSSTRAAATLAGLLSLDDRVRYQRRIEEVYWRHRTWPAENPGRKPALGDVLPEAVIRERVAEYLEQSVALEILWSRPLTGDQLQSELNRMVRDSKNLGLLRELFVALDDDPFLVAECLARPVLVERLARNLYTRDTRFQGAPREQGGQNPAVRPTEPSALQDLDTDPAKRPFETWWAEEGRQLVDSALHIESVSLPSGGYELQSPLGDGCTADSWTELWYQPAGRLEHTAVWTGAEMIVWGGSAEGVSYATGGRYDPATDSWRQTSTGAGAPTERFNHTAVWTGTEMIVWGGSHFDGVTHYYATGGRYDPATDTWTQTSTGTGVPTGRNSHTAVWTGTEMIVWGGGDSGATPLNSGGAYDPAGDSWTPTSTGPGTPNGRLDHAAVWSGTEMIVWGGFRGSSVLDTGGRYDPSTDSWTATPTGAGAPTARRAHTAVWTGTGMIVWGGYDGTYLNTGWLYDPAADDWTPTSTGADVPAGRSHHTAVWTGTEMIVWGGSPGSGSLDTGGRYAPSTDSWTPTSTGIGIPAKKRFHTAVWTGTEMIVWGGAGASSSGYRYAPATDRWTPTYAGDDAPHRRSGHTAVWTGAEMIVFGPVDGGRYDPATDSWATMAFAPDFITFREGHTAVWTGTEMIVWGGTGGTPYLNTGGRYDPAADNWTTTSTAAGVPSKRESHTAVWSGTEMIVWGGYDGAYPGTGGRYDPATDAWTATTGAGAPAGRAYHTAVWTGEQMVVWGGFDGAYPGTGGRYDPATDSWSPTLVAPPGRRLHTAVWTGTEMIVWGGYSFDGYLNNGGKYDPVDDSWLPTWSGIGTPTARSSHTALWTGTEMIVWGGGDGSRELSTGGRYHPGPNGWIPTSTASYVPAPRYDHTAVWTGTQAIVWGGYAGTPLNSGGLYCACEGGTASSWYPDADGDGYGVDSTGLPYCSQPPGYVPVSGDCDDTSLDTYPGAVEVNDGLDNQCPGDVGYGIVDEISGGCGFHNPDDRDELSWTPQVGATLYEIARSANGYFVTDCQSWQSAQASWVDSEPVAAGDRFSYLVRVAQPNAGSWGATSAGIERTWVCP